MLIVSGMQPYIIPLDELLHKANKMLRFEIFESNSNKVPIAMAAYFLKNIISLWENINLNTKYFYPLLLEQENDLIWFVKNSHDHLLLTFFCYLVFLRNYFMIRANLITSTTAEKRPKTYQKPSTLAKNRDFPYPPGWT